MSMTWIMPPPRRSLLFLLLHMYAIYKTQDLYTKYNLIMDHGAKVEPLF